MSTIRYKDSILYLLDVNNIAETDIINNKNLNFDSIKNKCKTFVISKDLNDYYKACNAFRLNNNELDIINEFERIFGYKVIIITMRTAPNKFLYFSDEPKNI